MIVVLAFGHGDSVYAQRFSSVPYGTPAGSSPTAELIGDVGIEQHLGTQLPLDAVFRDEQGREVKLGDYFDSQPVVVMLVYFRCPMLCTQVLNGFLKSSQAIPLVIGRDYQVVTVSFDPRETPDLAAEKKESYVRAYRRDGAAEGWHFLTGDQQSIDQLTKAVGFQYRFDPQSGQFAHASGIALATPDGRLSRYFYGIEYEPDDLRLGLVESSSGRIGSLVDQVLLLVLPLRPTHGQIRIGDCWGAADRRCVDRDPRRRFPGRHVSDRERRRTKLIARRYPIPTLPRQTRPLRLRRDSHD